MYYLRFNLHLQLKGKERGWRRQKIKLSGILQETLLRLPWSVCSPHPETCAAREDECSVSNEGLVQTMHFTYTECPCAFSTGLKSPGPWGRHCQRDPQALIHDGHGAASTVGTPLHINHWKSTLHAAFALHTGPKAGGVQHEQQHNAQILTWMLLFVSKFPQMKQVWLLISPILLFGPNLTGNLLWVRAQHEIERKLSKAPSTSVLLERSSVLFQPQFKPNLGLNLTIYCILRD